MTPTPVMNRRQFATARFGQRGHARRARGRSAPPPATASDYWLRVHRRAMACRFEVTLAGEHAEWVQAARTTLDAVDAIESQLTVFRDTSAVAELNRSGAAGPKRVDEDLFALVQLCQRLHDETHRAFDITSTPLSRCWGFLRREGRLPAARELASVMQCVGMHHVVTDPGARSVAFDDEGVELNFGAIGKGWALDRMAEMLAGQGVSHALLSAGRSSVRAIGAPWAIALTSPRVDRPLAHVTLRCGALGTSGAGEQYFEAGGRRYGHVIDPRTGWPADGPLSVSVITSDAACADALSTAFFVGGADLARSYCDAHDDVLVVLTPDDDVRQPVVIGEYPGADVEVASC